MVFQFNLLVLSCLSGSMLAGYTYAIYTGISEISAYPFIGKAAKCQKAKIPPTFFLGNACVGGLNGDEKAMKIALIKYGPLSVLLSMKMAFVGAKLKTFEFSRYWRDRI